MATEPLYFAVNKATREVFAVHADLEAPKTFALLGRALPTGPSGKYEQDKKSPLWRVDASLLDTQYTKMRSDGEFVVREQPAQSEQIAPGYVVMLRSGGFKMVVKCLYDDVAHVLWHDADGLLQTCISVPLACLQRAPSDAA